MDRAEIEDLLLIALLGARGDQGEQATLSEGITSPSGSSDPLLDRLLAVHWPSEAASDYSTRSKSHRSADGPTGTGRRPSRRSRPGSVTLVAGLLVAAAVLLSWWLRPPPRLDEASLPVFTFELERGDPYGMRGDPGSDVAVGSCEHVLGSSQRFSLRLVPSEPVTRDLEVAALAYSAGVEARWMPLSPPLQNEYGTVTIEQDATALGLGPGEWTVTVFVSGRGRTHDPDELRRMEPGSHGSVVVVRTTICMVR